MFGRSLIYSKKGPRTDPRGTPQLFTNNSEDTPLKVTIEGRYPNTPLPIKGTHEMLPHKWFSPQVNLCSYSVCLVRDFVNYPYEKGSIVLVGDHEYDLSTGDESSDDEFEKDDHVKMMMIPSNMK